ncbi:metal ABC transporter ATP-binding protein [Thermoproteota archaeon]
MNEVIKLKNIWVTYDTAVILEAVNLTIYENDFLAVIGPNGGGKSTLFKVILGLIKPFQGTVELFGKPQNHNRRLIGYVPQISHSDRSFPINVWETVLMGRLGAESGENRAMSHFSISQLLGFSYSKKDKEITEWALNRVEMLDLKYRQIGELSEGQRQRVFLARALASQPRLLLLDEPTASIDQPVQTSIYKLLGELNQEIPIVIVTHDITAISKHVKQLACLNRKLHYHGEKNLDPEVIKKTYGCPVELLAHGHPHRVLGEHD